jgi:hypothetical protein
MFLKKRSVSSIKDWVNERLREEGRNIKVTREQIYPYIDVAIEQGFFSLQAPPCYALSQRINDLYRVQGTNDNRITVVNAIEETTHDHVAQEAAALALALIKNLKAVKDTVHVGLGAGFTTLRIATYLAALLRAEQQKELPRLVLHALSTGFRVDQPLMAAVAFFSLFESLDLNIEYVGLFAPAVVATQNYLSVQQEPGVAESFEARGDIDLILTSLASANDDHGALNQFLAIHANDVTPLEREGWIGDVQYRPYSHQGPISQEADIRAVTLFDLPELVTLAQTPNKYVVVVAGPCTECGQTRTDALVPLLESRELKVWTHLVIDFQTANELVAHALPPDVE